jgi:hypothetical protein
MAIRVTFAGASLLVPGAYSHTETAESSVASPALGVVALIGEADEGPAFVTETGLSAVSFGPDEFAAIQDKYGSGELVDAARLAITPSNDPQIQGGAQELILIKTNSSTKASMVIPQGSSTLGTLKAKRAGEPGNLVSVAISIVSAKAVITLNRLDTGVTELSDPLGGNIVLNIQCTDSTASAATLTITDSTLSTTVTGGASTTANLSVKLSQFANVKALAAFIAAQPGYSASAASAAMGAKSVLQLDHVTALDIKTPATVKKDAFEVKDFFSHSGLVDFTPAIKSGLPTVMAKTFLSGGSRGATLQSSIQDGIDALMARRVNFIVPLFSRDAADEDPGYTDSSSNYDIQSIHAAVNAHVQQGSTVKGRKERQAFVGFKDSIYEASAEQSANLSSARTTLCLQNIDVVSASTGLIESKQPHMLAVIAAGMKASAAVGLPNTFKQPNIQGFSHPDFQPSTQAEKAISDNLCFVERSPSGAFRFVLDNSTYSQDADAWIYNRPSVLYAADTAAYAIRLNTEQYVGRRNSDVSEETIKNLLVGVMDTLKTAGIIVADNKTGGRGYKDLKVKIVGSIVTIGVTLSLVEGLEFILSDIKVQRAG